MDYKKLFSLILLPILSIKGVLAHCPLCTAGAAVAVGGAAWLGVNKVVLSLFVGAFAVSMGWWIGKMIKKNYIPFQRTTLIILSFILTVIPLLPILNLHRPFPVGLFGNYGSIFNRTYMINLSLVGSFFGGFIVMISPKLSKRITELRKGKHINYQTIIVTFLLLIIIGVIVQFSF